VLGDRRVPAAWGDWRAGSGADSGTESPRSQVFCLFGDIQPNGATLDVQWELDIV